MAQSIKRGRSDEEKDRFKAFRSQTPIGQAAYLAVRAADMMLAMYVAPEQESPRRLARVNTILDGVSHLRQKDERQATGDYSVVRVDRIVRAAYRAAHP